MMKFFVPAAVLALSLPTASLADWKGSYAGLSFGNATNLENEFSGDVVGTVEFDDTASTGLFIGSRMTNQQLVWGIEAAVEVLDDAQVADGEVDIETLFDIKLSGGMASGNLLGYGIFSLSSSYGNFGVNDVNGFGFGLGAGVAYKIGDQFSVSGEYLSRFMTEEFTNADVDITADTLTLRGAFHF